MKKILFFRHSDSPFNLNLSDHDRELSERGKKNAAIMGRRVNKRRIFPDFFISSTARRALDTCMIIKDHCNSDASVSQHREIYSHGISGIVNIIKDLNDEIKFISIVGHNPTMHQIHNNISVNKIQTYHTAGMMLCNVNVKSWNDFSFPLLEFIMYDHPENNSM